jgi:hypothetical protein
MPRFYSAATAIGQQGDGAERGEDECGGFQRYGLGLRPELSAVERITKAVMSG